jgi:hypothetical protein
MQASAFVFEDDAESGLLVIRHSDHFRAEGVRWTHTAWDRETDGLIAIVRASREGRAQEKLMTELRAAGYGV